MLRFSCASLLTACLLAGCNSYPVPSSPQSEPPAEHVDPTSPAACEQLVDHLKEQWIASMRQDIQESLEAALLPEECPGDLCGTPEGGLGGCGCGCGCPLVTLGPIAGPAGVDPESGAPLPVPGEADLLQHDERFIYLLGPYGLQIVDSRPPAAMRVVSRIPLEGVPWGMHLGTNRVTLLSLVSRSGEPIDCARFGGELFCTGAEPFLSVTVVDTTDRSHPVVVRSMLAPARLAASRQVAGAVHIALKLTLREPLFLDDWPADLPRHGGYDRDEVAEAFDALRRENERRIRATDVEDWIPRMQDTRRQPDATDRIESHAVLQCSDLLGTMPELGSGVLSVLSFDPSRAGGLRVTSIAGSHDQVVFSRSSLYTASTRPAGGDGSGESSELVKLSLDASLPRAVVRASGRVGGRVASRISLDEYESRLRVATTNAGAEDVPAHNAVYVLQQEGDVLRTIGSLTGIAPDTSILSARFLGERGFVAPARPVDGLVAVDLSDPRNPQAASVIANCGQCTMLQLLDRDHLLVLYLRPTADELELRMLEIDDLHRPVQIHAASLETEGSRHQLACDARAFGYTPAGSLLTAPVRVCESDAERGRRGGLVAWDVSPDTGFSVHGRVPFGTADDVWDEDWYGDACRWPTADVVVKRAFVKDAHLFTLSEKYLKANRLDDLSVDVRVIALDPSGE